jgi:hypothetical protein
MDTVSALLDGDVDGATDALLQTGLDVEDDVLDTVSSGVAGKAAASDSAASRRKTAACGAMADDEDEETQETVFGKATSKGKQTFLGGVGPKALSDYTGDYPYLLRHTAHASLYAYPDQRNTSLRGSLEEDGWEIRSEKDKWIIAQNGSLCVLSYAGTTDVMGDGGFWDQAMMDSEYSSVGVRQGYMNLFDRETGGINTVKNFLKDADDDATFIFTGHSKGGLFAQIAGVRTIDYSARPRASVVAYGVPPIFSSDGASVVNEMSHAFLRVSKENDPVVIYNPDSRSCNGGGLFRVSQLAIDIVESGFDSLDTVPTRDSVLTGIQTHKMPGYLRSVENLTLDECLH